ncbi:MAG: DUF1698 domain-containing protein [Acidobacteriota bacterium]|jgi:tRNA (mo5U34)-methyltransferase
MEPTATKNRSSAGPGASPAPPPSRDELLAEVRRLSPFYHAVELPHGVRTHDPALARRAVERTRVEDLAKYLRPLLRETFGESLAGRRVLDAACNCGGFSVEAARLGAERVLGIDVVERYLEQARFIRRSLALEDRWELRNLAVEDLCPEEVGRVDVTFLFDVLYHFENPVLAMDRLSAVTERMIVVETRITRRRIDAPVWIMNFLPPADPDGRDASTSLWRERRRVQFCPNPRAVIELLQHAGFSDARQVPLEGAEAAKEWPADDMKLGLFVGIRSPKDS